MGTVLVFMPLPHPVTRRPTLLMGQQNELTTFCTRLSFHLHPLGEVVRSALQERANCHDDRTNEDSTLATKRIADENGEYCAAETPKIV